MLKYLKRLFASSIPDPIIKTIEITTRSAMEILKDPPKFNHFPDRIKELRNKLAIARGMLYSVKYKEWTMSELNSVLEETEDDGNEDLS